jgi:phosphatidylglycerol:prolipoprotein diacylglycerol transferase
MLTITLDPIIAHIGPLVLRWYSLILLVAIGVGVWLTARESERKGFKKDDVYEVAIYIILGGILGARLFHVLDQWSNEFAANPIRALYIWEGGLAIWGAVVGGLVAAGLISWKRRWNFSALLDAAAPALVLSQAIGRLACVILYSLERFFLAFTSSYRIIAFGLTQSQIIALFGLSVGTALLSWMSRKLNKQAI